MEQPALEKDDESLKQLSRAAAAALAKGDLASAKACCIRMLEQRPGCADAYYYLGLIAGNSGRNRVAVDTLRKAIVLDAQRPEFHAQIARFLLLAGRCKDAVMHASNALDAGIDDAFQLDTVGCVLSQAGLQKEAALALGRATKLAPGNGQYRYNYASCLRFLGDMDAAEEQFEACIGLSPEHYKAHWGLSHLRRQDRYGNHIQRLEVAAHESQGIAEAQSFLHYALGKEHEDLEQYDLAYHHYAAGASARRRLVTYDTRESVALIETIIGTFDTEFCSSGSEGWASEDPIFVFGMPRSGTTLVERILSSHTDVSFGGEFLNFGIEVKRLSRVKSPAFIDESTVGEAANVDMVELGRAYVESTRPATAQGRKFVDKLPFNFLYLGLIARALPRARLVHVQRGPMDTCFSMFKQRFAAAYDYSYTQEEMAAYYILYSRLMDHWRSVLGRRIHEVQYEELVLRQATTSRKLLDFCGLDWQKGCLDFHLNDAPVSTASASQVRQRIYRSSLHGWRKFERYLAPLRQTLEAGDIALQFDDCGTSE